MRLESLGAVYTNTPVQLENRKNKIKIDTGVLCHNVNRQI